MCSVCGIYEEFQQGWAKASGHSGVRDQLSTKGLCYIRTCPERKRGETIILNTRMLTQPNVLAMVTQCHAGKLPTSLQLSGFIHEIRRTKCSAGHCG